MAINFPDSPSIGATYSFNGINWQYSGSGWFIVPTTAIGNTGATGSTGPQGITGPVGDYVISVNGLTGILNLEAGSNISITPSGNTLTIASTASGGISGPYVSSFNGLTGDVTGTSISRHWFFG